MLKQYYGAMAALVFIAFSFSFLSWEWRLEDKQETAHKNVDAKKEDAQSGQANKTAAQHQSEAAYAAKDHSRTSPEWNLVYITIFLTAFTFGLMVYTFHLWSEAKETAKRQLRAYVGVVYPEVKVDFVERELVASIDYQNAGQTPAHDVVVKMSAELFDHSPGFSPPWEPPGTANDDGKGGLLLPGVIWQKYAPIVGVEYGGVLKAHLENERKRVWVWGTISYMDAFGKDCFVKFRFWSGTDIRDQRPLNWGNGKTGQFFPLISERASSEATYGQETYRPRQQ